MGNLTDADLKLLIESSNSRPMKDLMTDAGLDILQLSALCGVSIRTVYRWLSGDTKVPQSTLTVLHLLSPMP